MVSIGGGNGGQCWEARWGNGRQWCGVVSVVVVMFVVYHACYCCCCCCCCSFGPWWCNGKLMVGNDGAMVGPTVGIGCCCCCCFVVVVAAVDNTRRYCRRY